MIWGKYTFYIVTAYSVSFGIILYMVIKSHYKFTKAKNILSRAKDEL